MKVWVYNPNNIPQAIIQSRLQSIEPFASVQTNDLAKEVDGRIVFGEFVNIATFDNTELSKDQLNILVSTPPTLDETDWISQTSSLRQQVKSEYKTTIDSLQAFENIANPTNAQTLAIVRLLSKCVRLILRLLANRLF